MVSSIFRFHQWPPDPRRASRSGWVTLNLYLVSERVFCLFAMFIRRLHESSRDQNKLNTSGGFKQEQHSIVAHSSCAEASAANPRLLQSILKFPASASQPRIHHYCFHAFVNGCGVLLFGGIAFDICCSKLPSEFLNSWAEPHNKPTSLFLLLWKRVEPPA